jgi:hypothetical protein
MRGRKKWNKAIAEDKAPESRRVSDRDAVFIGIKILTSKVTSVMAIYRQQWLQRTTR